MLSVATMSLELSFPLVIFFPLTHWVLVPAALAFHLGTRVAMRIDYLRFLGPAYLAFVAPLLWQITRSIGLQ